MVKRRIRCRRPRRESANRGKRGHRGRGSTKALARRTEDHKTAEEGCGYGELDRAPKNKSPTEVSANQKVKYRRGDSVCSVRSTNSTKLRSGMRLEEAATGGAVHWAVSVSPMGSGCCLQTDTMG